MAQSLSKLYVHIIFHIKNQGVTILKKESKELYAYIGFIIKDNDSLPIRINGTVDHIHILCVMSRNITISKLVEEIKRHSSRWIKTKGIRYKYFSWQKGYGCFSVSASVHDRTVRYIDNQEDHHKRRTFEEEYRMFLKEYDIEYDERYVWND